MGLINRDKDASEQRDVWTWTTNTAVGVSQSLNLFIAPFSCQVLGLQVAAFGLSATPTLNWNIQRFIVGSGVTTLATGFTTATVGAAFGTSGPIGATGVGVGLQGLTAGTSLLTMQKGDIFICISSTANSAATYAQSIITQRLQDITSDFSF
jgi:hypothetical protein